MYSQQKPPLCNQNKVFFAELVSDIPGSQHLSLCPVHVFALDAAASRKSNTYFSLA